MKFREVSITYVGVQGIEPEGWQRAGDGMHARAKFPGDPTMLWQRAYLHVDPAGFKAVLVRELGLDAFPGPVKELHLGTVAADFALAANDIGGDCLPLRDSGRQSAASQ